MKLDFWYEFGSTYSYPAAMRIESEAAKGGIEVVWRPFLLGPIFKAQGWNTSPFNIYPSKGVYMWRDMERICNDLGIPFRRPETFPQNGLLAARVALTEAVADHHPGFVRAVFTAEFAEGRQIAAPEVIGEILTDLGLNTEIVFEQAQESFLKETLKKETATAAARQIFGAPTFITKDGEMFWGNDRLVAAIAWCQKIEQQAD